MAETMTDTVMVTKTLMLSLIEQLGYDPARVTKVVFEPELAAITYITPSGARITETWDF